MTDFRMPDSWYDPPDDVCETCDGVGCVQCDPFIASLAAAEVAYDRSRDE
jgi:hypothetical protein